MKTIFVCLANSKKYGERCIAGIELRRDEEGLLFLLKHEDGRPKWIRPVSNTSHGEVSAHLVNIIRLTDIVELEVLAACPQGYQSENVLFDSSSIRVVEQKVLSSQSLDRLIENHDHLFGNHLKVISEGDILEINRSLIFIRAREPSVYTKIGIDKNQIRMKFNYGNHAYDLPITDVLFSVKFFYEKDLLKTATHVYLTISLSALFEGSYYKLVAGVVYV